jgi:hypothetical protein
MTMFMETTRINAERTVGEIHDVLRRHGANAILNEYEVANVSAVSFKTLVGGQEVAFRLPARWKELETYLRGTGKKPKHPDTYETWARWEEEKYIVHTGCFVGSLNEFEKRVKETHKDGIHREEYLLFIPLLRKRMESTEEGNKWYLASKKK